MLGQLLVWILMVAFTYQKDGIGFEFDKPESWVVDNRVEDSLVGFSDREGLEYLSINVFEELMWGTCLAVFSDNTKELEEIGYTLVSKSAFSKDELRRANASDGARFHFVKHDGEVHEHIIMEPIAKENLVLVLTFYLPRWREDETRLLTIEKVIASFHFLNGKTETETKIPPPPPLK